LDPTVPQAAMRTVADIVRAIANRRIIDLPVN
jgi:hypothetical protein